jgi:predicted GTPase
MSSDSTGGLIITDFPGLGESIKRDEEYIKLYKDRLPQLDLVLWVLDSSTRAYSIDEKFYNDHFKELGEACPMIFVLNKVDIMHPPRSWDEKNNCPSDDQQKNIQIKVKVVAEAFSMDEKRISPISSDENFGLVELVSLIVEVLPNEKKFSFVRETKKENVSEESAAKAEKGFWASLLESLKTVKEFYVENKDVINKLFIAVATWYSKPKK